MKTKIIKIAQDLKKGTITTELARKLLLDLFGVSGSASYEYEEDDMDITKCPKCGSTDHTMITGMPYKCMDCGTTWV